jgi:hypothetical protein
MIQTVRFVAHVTATARGNLAGAAASYFSTTVSPSTQHTCAASSPTHQQEPDVVDCVVVGAGEPWELQQGGMQQSVLVSAAWPCQQ